MHLQHLLVLANINFLIYQNIFLNQKLYLALFNAQILLHY